MTKTETAEAELADYFDEACQELGLEKPISVPVELWLDECTGGWFELQVGPEGACPRSEQEKRTIGAWGLALFRLNEADAGTAVVFPGPNGLSHNHVSVHISPAVYKQILPLVSNAQAS